MPSCDAVLKIRAVFNFGPQKELLPIRGNPQSSPAFGSGFARLGFPAFPVPKIRGCRSFAGMESFAIKSMSEFKFACPVCGQHITADSRTSGERLECPTCFRKIIVPQAPADADSKLILSAAQADKPRPPQSNPELAVPFLRSPRRNVLSAVAGTLLLLAAAAAGIYLLRDRLFKRATPESQALTKRPPKSVYPVPTNVSWTLKLGSQPLPEGVAVGQIHGEGFQCERATLQAGNLTLRQGKTWPPDLGVSIALFAKQGEELSGKTVEVSADRQPPVPRVTLRWKDERDMPITHNFASGYALKIEFGEAASGRMPGRIYLCIPDESRSVIAGDFDAEIRKPPPPKPKQPKAAPKPKG